MDRVRFMSLTAIVFIVLTGGYVTQGNYEGAQTAALVAIAFAILSHLE